MPDISEEIRELCAELKDPLHRHRTKQDNGINWEALIFTAIIITIIYLLII